MTSLPTIPQPLSPPLTKIKGTKKKGRPSPTQAQKRVSEAVYWKKYYDYVGPEDHNYEWNNGYLEERPSHNYISYLMYSWFEKSLDHFLEVQPLAQTIGLGMGFRLALPPKTVIRKPDLGVVLNSNPVPLGLFDQSYRGIFDICIECLSYGKPSEVERDTVTKKQEYAQGGVQEYYLLDSRGEETAFYQLTAGGIYVPLPLTPDGLIASQILPGFQFRLMDTYQQPWQEQMSKDPAVSQLVLTTWSATKRAWQAMKQAPLVAESPAPAEREARQLAESKIQSVGCVPRTIRKIGT
jgi:Uma2 family endonuclease